jgi:hypothetical protein
MKETDSCQIYIHEKLARRWHYRSLPQVLRVCITVVLEHDKEVSFTEFGINLGAVLP